MKTLVTGGSGLLGNNVVRHLLERGHSVRVLTRTQTDPRPFQGLDVETFVGDVRDRDAVLGACRGMDWIVHAAGWVHIGWTGAKDAEAINVQGTNHVAEGALAAQAKLVHVSSVDTLGLPQGTEPADEASPRGGKTPCPYVLSKTRGEEVVRQWIQQGLKAVIVNPGFMWGPWDWKPSSGKMLLAVADRFAPVAPCGGCSICDVRDVAAGILAAAERGTCGRNYILAGANVSYLELWREVSRMTHGRPVYKTAGPLLRMLGCLFGRTWTFLHGWEPKLNSASVEISTQRHHYSSARAIAELSYRIRPLEETIADTWNWFREHGYTKQGKASA